MRAVVALIAAIGCGDSSPSTGDASQDTYAGNPPLECPTTNPLTGCTVPLPSLAGTWRFSPSTTMTLTLTASGNQMLAGTTAGTTAQMMHLFDGDWTVEANGAWRCSRNGAARTLSSICTRTSGELGINGETRAPGFHTAYETLESFSGVLAP
jgi:hypothetical protein